MSARVRHVSVAHRRLVAKSATGRSRALVRREAQLLERIGPDLVVPVVALREHDDRTDLVLDDAGPHSLAEPAHLGLRERVDALRRCAEALGELHERGWSHGALCAEHVVVDPTRGVRFCSLGSARPCGPGDPDQRHDHEQLLGVVGSVARSPRPADCSPFAWWRVRRWLERDVLGHDPPANPSELAARLTPGPRSGTSLDLPVPPVQLLAAAAVLVLSASALAVSRPGAPPRPPEATQGVEPVAAPAGPGPSTPGGHVVELDGARFRVGRSGDVALALEGCPGDTVVALRPSSGQVVRFDRLAGPGEALRGEPVARIDGAVGLHADPGVCEVVHAVTADRSRVPIELTGHEEGGT